MFGARAACARCARARDSTHRDTCRPPPSVSKTNAQSRRVAIMVSGGPAHTRPYASTPAVHVKNNLTLIAGCPRMIQFRHFVLFFARESARVAHTYDPRCPELYFVLFFASECARRANKYDQICCRTWSTWRIWRTRRAWHAWAPASRTRGRIWFPVAAHPKTAAEHAEARVLLMCWEGVWE